MLPRDRSALFPGKRFACALSTRSSRGLASSRTRSRFSRRNFPAASTNDASAMLVARRNPFGSDARSTPFRLPSLEFGVSLSSRRHGRAIPPLVGGCFGPRVHVGQPSRGRRARTSGGFRSWLRKEGVSLSLPLPEQLEQLHNGPGTPFARLSRNKLWPRNFKIDDRTAPPPPPLLPALRT